MREGIHPKYKPAKVVCACGNVVETRSTRGDFTVEICAACHPFFTGKQKIMDTAGRIERFKTRYAAGTARSEAAPAAAKPAAAPAPRAESKKPNENRAAKRAKANASKPRAKAEAAPAEASSPAAAEAAPAPAAKA